MAKSKLKITRVAQLKSAEAFKNYLSTLEIDMPFKEHLSPPEQSVMGQSFKLKSGHTIGNRFCILPMEGWDALQTVYPRN